MSMGDALVWILAIVFAGIVLLTVAIVIGTAVRGAIAWREGYAQAKRDARERQEAIVRNQPATSGTIESP